MTRDGYKRKLSAILSADVKGYSRMMGTDEEATVRNITVYREVFTEYVLQHRGRIVDTPGDNILAEYESVVDALKCGMEIQEALKVKNANLPANRRMEFRIGINLGDVIQEEKRIYGDGVNIAARIEGLADPGGICISRSAYDQLRGKLKVGYEYLGEHAVKNISEPVRVYRVLTDPGYAGKVLGEKRYLNTISRKWATVVIATLIIVSGGLTAWVFQLNQSRKIEPVSMEKLAFPLPEKPSVAILPFKDLSSDQSHQYLVNGTTDAVRIALARVPNLFVIDHNSSSLYKDKDLKIKQVAEELGVRYVIEGSVQQSGETTRINAKLIDAIAGRYIWAETFDSKPADLLVLQDEISQMIANELEVQLTEGEQARIWFRQTDNLEAYRKFRIGKEHYRKRNKRDNITARKLYEQAILLDPEFAEAECHLGFTYIQDALNGWTKKQKGSL
jgi:TolB-like protein/class 3 adenylate cyclase